MEHSNRPYLEDVVMPEASEGAPGWNVDHEFGAGTQSEIVSFLEANVKSYLSSFPASRQGKRDALSLIVANSADLIVLDPTNTLLARARETIRKSGWRPENPTQAASYKMVGFGPSARLEAFISDAEETLNSELGKGLDGAHSLFILRVLRERSHDDALVVKKSLEELRQDIPEVLREGNDDLIGSYVAQLRLLRARDIQFIPGKGVEIIDNSPEEFQKEPTPLPEQRNF